MLSVGKLGMIGIGMIVVLIKRGTLLKNYRSVFCCFFVVDPIGVLTCDNFYTCSCKICTLDISTRRNGRGGGGLYQRGTDSLGRCIFWIEFTVK